MSISSRELDQVVVYNALVKKAFWMTPSEAKRYCSAIPPAEIIDEQHEDWEWYRRLAGPKPIRIVHVKENDRTE